MPRYLPAGVVLATSEQAAIVLHAIGCFPTGFGFSVDVVSRYEQDPYVSALQGPFGSHGRHEHRARFEIRYSDGRQAALIGPVSSAKPNDAAEELTLILSGVGGDTGGWTYDLWTSPLPPPGPVIFAVEWPSCGIESASYALDGKVFISAARHARSVFGEPRSTPVRVTP